MSNYLYRIMSFPHVVDMLQNERLFLSHPSKWDDPYECKLEHDATNALFGQCWTKNSQSDAMWRIYSPDRLGLRIRTTEEKMRDALREGLRKDGLRLRIAEVEYLPSKLVNKRLQKLRESLELNFDPSTAADALQLKREAFAYEDEVRLIVLKSGHQEFADFIHVQADTRHMIDDILVDPRADDCLVEAITMYFEKALNFTGNIGKSRLYSPQKTIRVPRVEIATDEL